MKFLGVAIAATLTLSALPAVAAENPKSAVVSCIPVSTAAELQAIKDNLSGTYCITADIDASSIPNFTRIGTDSTPFFTGRIYGNGHVIRNLTINEPTGMFVGMISVMFEGVIQDLGLVNANITAPNGSLVGALIGATQTTPGPISIRNVFSTGQVTTTRVSGIAGGLIGASFDLNNNQELTDSWSSASVSANGAAGGVIGEVYNSIGRIYATGPVTCTSANCFAAGGAIGFLIGPGAPFFATDIFASGPVIAGNSVSAGGLIGLVSNAATIKRGYATGPVTGGTTSNVGSVFGSITAAASVSETFGAGHLTAGAGSSLGGHTGKISGGPTIAASYWDTITTGGVLTTAGTATGQTTEQLQAGLPTGFSTAGWGITKTLSYPFLNSQDQFASTLSTLVQGAVVYTYLPLDQSDLSLYTSTPTPTHTDEASLATVLTIMARGIGRADGSVTLQNALVSDYWNDTTQKTKLKGELKTHLTPSILKFKPVNTGSANVLHALKAGNLVVLSGTYTKSDGTTGTHAMLATLFTKTPTNAVHTLVALDPMTGAQVEINPKTKRVVTPGFPLTNFKVKQFETFEVD